MKKTLLSTTCALLLAGGLPAVEPAPAAAQPIEKNMTTTPAVSLGYVILYVQDVSASLAFYEKAFGFTRRFFNDENGKAYGEMDAGAVRLGFVNFTLAKEALKQDFVATAPDRPALGMEIALLTSDVPAALARAVAAGATAIGEPEQKPWGQTVVYLRDNAGHLVELATPMP